MGVWWQRGRRSKRSPGRLLGHVLDARYGAAEGILGAVALVLVVWLLWPEERGPQFDQRATWRQTVEDVERRRTEPGGQSGDETQRTADERASALGNRSGVAEHPTPTDRRQIARPSELADRLERTDLQRTFLPGPKRPSGSREETTASDTQAQTEVASQGVDPLSSASESDNVRAALERMVNGLQTGSELPAELGDVTTAPDDGDEPPVDVAVLSSEALDAEPLPEVDLSDLDSLVPLDDAEIAPTDPAPDAAIEPLAARQDSTTSLTPEASATSAAPTTDVRERPRDDAPSWLKNAVTTAAPDERPMIAVVIDDLGLNRSNTAALNTLPSPLTLAFLPYAGRIEAQTQAAQDAGHELMLHLPMEPVGSDWPGPDALTTRIDRQEFTDRLQKNLASFEGFVGINNHMGSKLTADRSRMEVVMRELRERDVLFLDSKTSARSVAGDVAGQSGVPNTTRDIFLDHVIDLESIKRQLARAETVARRTGSAVAIGHPHGATIEALRAWLPSLEARGFTLAPISAVVARRACSSGVLIATETCGRYLQARKPSDRAIVAKDG